MKKAENPNSRKKRVDHLSGHITPLLRFLTGFVCIIIFISLNQLAFRFTAVIFAGILSVISGKRISWLYFLSFLFFVVLFHLLSPFGLVLFRLGPLAVTAGALEAGLDKGFLFIGFVFISLFSVARNLRIPGRFGQMIARMFVYFEMLYENKTRIQAKTLLPDIDSVLAQTWNDSDLSTPQSKPVSPFHSACTLGIIVLIFGLIKTGDLIFRLKIL